MNGPLDGLKVLDFGHCYAGPAVAMALSDQGAEVIHIDRPGAPVVSGPADKTLNRNKRRITLNLKEDEDRAMARSLVVWADVIIENFRPGVMDRLGYGYADCKRMNPAAIYLSLPGFPSDNARLRGLRAFEGIVMAAGGGFMDLSINRTLAGENPTFTPIPLASCYAAAYGAAAVMLAVSRREKDGLGDHIEVDLYSSLLEGMAYSSYHVVDEPTRYQSLRERELVQRRASNDALNMDYAAILSLQDPFFRTYLCKDDRPFYVVSLSHRAHPERVLKVLGLWNEAHAAGIPLNDPYTPSSGWSGEDPCSLYAQPLNRQWSDWLTPRMAARFATKTAVEWEAEFENAGAVGLAVRSMSEWLRSPYAEESGLVVNVKSDAGTTRQMGPLVWLERDHPRNPEDLCSSAQGADRETVLAIAARADTPIQKQPGAARSATRPYWAAGMKVVDLCNVIAGPTIGAMLARFGADVTNIQPVRPGIDPWMNIVFGLRAHTGKRSMLMDIRTEQGKAILMKMLEDTDVLTLNMTGSQLCSLGLDLDDLQKRFPRLVIFALDAFGGPTRQGAYVNYRGYDELGQAMTGVMVRFGGGLHDAELHAQVGAIDALTGVWALFGTALALYRRSQTGRGQVARSSLTAIAQFIQLPFFADHGDPIDEGPGGRGLLGTGPLNHCYEVVDGMVFLAGLPENWPALSGALALRGEAEVEKIAKALHGQSYAALAARLSGTTVEITLIRSGAEIRCEDLVSDISPGDAFPPASKRFIRETDHPLGRPVTQVAPSAIRTCMSRVRRPTPAEKFGHSTRSVLKEYGYSTEVIETLAADGIISDKWSEAYLPD